MVASGSMWIALTLTLLCNVFMYAKLATKRKRITIIFDYSKDSVAGAYVLTSR